MTMHHSWRTLAGSSYLADKRRRPRPVLILDGRGRCNRQVCSRMGLPSAMAAWGSVLQGRAQGARACRTRTTNKPASRQQQANQALAWLSRAAQHVCTSTTARCKRSKGKEQFGSQQTALYFSFFPFFLFLLFVCQMGPADAHGQQAEALAGAQQHAEYAQDAQPAPATGHHPRCPRAVTPQLVGRHGLPRGPSASLRTPPAAWRSPSCRRYPAWSSGKSAGPPWCRDRAPRARRSRHATITACAAPLCVPSTRAARRAHTGARRGGGGGRQHGPAAAADRRARAPPCPRVPAARAPSAEAVNFRNRKKT